MGIDKTDNELHESVNMEILVRKKGQVIEGFSSHSARTQTDHKGALRGTLLNGKTAEALKDR